MPTLIYSSFRRRLTAVALVLAMAAAALVTSASAASASDGDVVRFDGSGWGHGVGLSQWGAYGMALEGSTHGEILAHYFQGTGLGTIGQGTLTAAGPLWVNLELDFDTLVLRVDAISDGGAPVTITRGAGSWEAPVGSTLEIRGPDDCSIYVDPPGDGNAFETPAGGCSFDLSWYDHLSAEDPTTRVAIPGCTNRDWNVVPYEDKECRYGRGMLHVRKGAGGLDLSVELTLDDYVLGISEMPYFWGGSGGGQDALEAQAIAARSYARELQIYRSDLATNNCAAWCHVRDTTFDQRYVGWGHGQSAWIDAVNDTAGVVVTHPDAPNGGVVRAYYSSSTGGHTENIQEVWTGWDARSYYQGVTDHWAVDGTVTNANKAWTVDLDVTTVAAAVGLATVTGVEVTERNTSGSARTVVFSNGSETVTLSSASVKSMFGLKSIYFDASRLSGSAFLDIAGSPHAESIIEIYERGVTKGCNPPANNRYCPGGSVTRGQMAAFLNRAFDFPAPDKDYFSDDGTSIFEDDINRMAASGITLGCGDGVYCPSRRVSRGEMAAFLDRAFGFAETSVDHFTDDNGSTFEDSINRIAAAGVTFGCNPPANDAFCPNDSVARAQMASFITRSLEYIGS
jgi:SpoIID/LytB domain protein